MAPFDVEARTPVAVQVTAHDATVGRLGDDAARDVVELDAPVAGLHVDLAHVARA